MPIEAARLQIVVETKGRAAINDLNQVEKAAVRVTASINAIDKAGSKLGRSGGFLPGLANVSEVVQGLPQVGRLVGAFTDPLLQATEAGVKFNAWLETTKIGLTTMLGSASKAQEQLDALAAFGKETPFQFEGLVKSTQRMMAYGFEAGRVIPILRDVGDAVSATGDISEEVFNGIIVALGQMRAKGKVSAEEMEQLAERGIPAWQMLADAIGLSVKETRKLAEAGRLKGGPAVDALLSQMRSRFGGNMEKLNATFEGRKSNLEDIYQRAQGLATQGLFSDLNQMMADALKRENLADTVATNINTAVTPVSGVVRAAFSTLIGGNIIAGFKEGIDAGKGAVRDSVIGMAQDAVLGPFTKILGIESPSKVFYQYGLWTAEGFKRGFETGMQGQEGLDPMQAYLSRLQRQIQAAYRNKLTNDKRFIGFEAKLGQVSQALGIDPNWLLNVMAVETSGTFDPAIQNPKSKATGLIQFMPEWSKAATAKALGTTVAELKKMTATQQLDYVQKYFEMMGASGRMASQADVYNVVTGKWKAGGPADAEVYRKGSKEYEANWLTWDLDRDGIIKKSELGQVAWNKGGFGANPATGEVVPVRIVAGPDYSNIKGDSRIDPRDLKGDRPQDLIGGASQPGVKIDAGRVEITSSNVDPGFGSQPSEPPFKFTDVSEWTDEKAQAVVDTFKAAQAQVVSTSVDISSLGSVIVPRAIDASNKFGESVLKSALAVQEQTMTAKDWYAAVVVQSEEAARRLVVQWDDAASGFENVFLNATDRWLDDGENFFRAFGLGFAGLIRQLSAQALAANLGKLLFGYDGSQGSAGGGWIGRLIGWGLGALAGSITPGIAGHNAIHGGNSAPGGIAGGNGFHFTPGRASGGHVQAGQPYWVGESGREPFIPDTSGRILSSQEANRLMQGGGQGGGVTINFHVTAPGGDIPRSTQEQMTRRMLDALSHTQQRGG